MTKKEIQITLKKINIINEIIASIARRTHGYYDDGWHNERAFLIGQIEQGTGYKYIVKELEGYDDRCRVTCTCTSVAVDRLKWLEETSEVNDPNADYWNKGPSTELLRKVDVIYG